MKSRIEGRNYIVLPNEAKFPVKLNQKRVNKTLMELDVSLKKIQFLMKQLYETDYDAYKLIVNQVFGENVFDFDEGKSHQLNMMIDNLDEFYQQLLTGNDEIPAREEIETLEDLGYSCRMLDRNNVMYEKTLKKAENEDVIEQIFEWEGKVVRWIRTIYWEESEFGRSGKSTRRKIGNTKRLIKAFLVSKKERESK